ncbi:MAG: ABC transporter permease [Bacteroidetes bacterium]|nr:ABC transporter permease [Bacteroidota bacterium]
MSFEFFISKRLIRNNAQGIKVSKPIIRISVISISLAIVVNLVTIAIVTGFQNEVRGKIVGFNAPLFISKAGATSLYECDPIHKNQTEIELLKETEGIDWINPVCYKPALLQSSKYQDTIQLSSGKDSMVQKQDIAGVVMKGVDKNYDWSFIKKHLVQGRIPKYDDLTISQEIVISSKTASNLNFHLNDDVLTFYVKDQPVSKRYKVVGIFNTGLEEFDKKIVFSDIREVQRVSDFGISTEISIEDTISKSGSILLRANISGNTSDLLFDWGKGPDVYGGILLNQLQDTTIRLIVHQMDYARNLSNPLDTSYISFDCGNQLISAQSLKRDTDNLIYREEDTPNSFFLFSKNQKIKVSTVSGKGTYSDFVTGYEVQIKKWEDLTSVQENLQSSIEMKPTKYGELLQIQSITDTQGDLFAWLNFLDYNVLIIVILMLLIGIINVGSAMLVLIVVRTNFIGILKALGSTNWSIRKIFLMQAAYLIVKGMLIGNVIGISLCLIQTQFGIFTLDPSIYYLDKVPVELTFLNWLMINFITFSVCILALIIPSYVVTRISPTKAIRFN